MPRGSSLICDFLQTGEGLFKLIILFGASGSRAFSSEVHLLCLLLTFLLGRPPPARGHCSFSLLPPFHPPFLLTSCFPSLSNGTRLFALELPCVLSRFPPVLSSDADIAICRCNHSGGRLQWRKLFSFPLPPSLLSFSLWLTSPVMAGPVLHGPKLASGGNVERGQTLRRHAG